METKKRIPVLTFGDRIRLARRGAGLTQGEVADHLGVPVGRYSNWESGANGCRDLIHVATQISELTDIDLPWLLGIDDYPRINSCYPADISVPFMFAPHQAGDDN